MPRGKAWTKAESIALVEAFVHISEDEIVGVNQRKETLFERVIAEAKLRYSGDWARGTQACKSRWQIVSREVSKFIAADLLVSSVERSGWNDQDYFKATVLAYHGVRGDKGNVSDIHEDDLPLSDSELNAPVPEFEFKEEWLILRDHEKWRITLSKQETRRKAQAQLSLDSSAGGSNSNELASGNSPGEETTAERPIGIKKAKTALAMKNNQEAVLLEIRNQQQRAEKLQAEAATRRDTMIANLMTHMDESAEKSFNNFQSIVSESTQEITKAIKIKMLMETDWTGMGKAFRGRLRKTVKRYFQDTLEPDGESLESSGDDDDDSSMSGDGKMPAKKTSKKD